MPTLYSRNKQNGVLFMLAIQALAFSFTGCKKPALSEPDKPPIASKEQNAPVAVPAAPAPSQIPAVATTNSPLEVLVFRNVRSWNRKPDFEEALTELGVKFEVKPSTDMERTDLARYSFV